MIVIEGRSAERTEFYHNKTEGKKLFANARNSTEPHNNAPRALIDWFEENGKAIKQSMLRNLVKSDLGTAKYRSMGLIDWFNKTVFVSQSINLLLVLFEPSADVTVGRVPKMKTCPDFLSCRVSPKTGWVLLENSNFHSSFLSSVRLRSESSRAIPENIASPSDIRISGSPVIRGIFRSLAGNLGRHDIKIGFENLVFLVSLAVWTNFK